MVSNRCVRKSRPKGRTSETMSNRSAQKAAELVFEGGRVPDETAKVHKHRESLEFQKSAIPNFLQVMKEQALKKRGVTVEQDLETAQKLYKYTQVTTIDDKRKHLASYEDDDAKVTATSKGPRDLTDAEFEAEAMQRALDDLKQSSKPTVPTAANERAAKKARVADEAPPKEKEKEKPKGPVAKANTLALSFAVEDDDDD